jgi:hypothetical protein
MIKKNNQTNNGFIQEESDDESLSSKGPIITYGADYTLDSIRQYVTDSKQIIVQPGFQRNFVWDIKKASKLIESFILGYPVPNILLGRDPETEVMEVIDGQQRIISVCDFFEGIFRKDKIFKLTGDIDQKFINKTFSELDEATQKKLRNAVLKAVVLVYPKNDHNIKFTAFHRINTGSVVLNQQEIRNCIYGGSFNDTLKELNESNKNWRKLLSKNTDKRMRDVETILRFFASYFRHSKYEKSLTEFLNIYMDDNRDISTVKQAELKELFESTLDLVFRNIGFEIFPKSEDGKAFNRSIFESVMVAIARLNQEKKINPSSLKAKYKILIKNSDYINAVGSQTSDKKKYLDRLDIAYNILK